MSEETELQASLVYVVINVLPVRMRRVKEKDVAAENSDNIFRTNRGKYIWHIEWDVDAPKYPLRFLGAEQNRRKASNSRMADEKRQAAGGEGHRKSSWRSPTPLRVEFVGVPPIYVPSAARYGVDKILSHSFQCHPVFLEREVAHQHYQGFCKGALWPIMHNVIDMYNSADYTSMLDSWRPSADSGRSISSDGKSGTTDNDETDWKPRRSWNPLAQEQCWPHHCAANAAFAHKLQVIGADLGEGAGSPIIWVHGYELLLLPSYLLRKVPGANVGLFLDLPFPSSEIFRTLAVREEILRAMLSASHIGFHLYEYARHFLTCCKRMLGVDFTCEQGGQIQILHNRRKVWVTCCHGGIDVGAVRQLSVPDLVPKGSADCESQVQSHASPDNESGHYFGSDEESASSSGSESEEGGEPSSGPRSGTRRRKANKGKTSRKMDDELICQIFGSMKTFGRVVLGGGSDGRRRTRQVIVGVDPLEALRGIPLKLLAFDRFLTENPDWASRVVLVQIGLELDSRPDDYRRVCKDVEELVCAMQKRWPNALFYRKMASMSAAKRKRLWQLGDVYFNVPLRVGLDTMPLEFLIVREQHNHDILARYARDKEKRRLQRLSKGRGVGTTSSRAARELSTSEGGGLWQEKVLPLQASVVISEMCGSSRVLSSAVRVNAYKTADVANGLHTALISWDNSDRFGTHDTDTTTTATEASDAEGSPGKRIGRRNKGRRQRLQVTVTTPAVVQDLLRIRQNSLGRWALKVLLDVEGSVAANNEDDEDDEDNENESEEEGEEEDDEAAKVEARAQLKARQKREHKHSGGLIGFGFGVRQLPMGRNRLDMKNCSAAYTASWRRVILIQQEKILDQLDTTQLAFKQETPQVVAFNETHEALPGQPKPRTKSSSSRARKQLWEIKNVLTRLCEDPKNRVCILSTGPRLVLEHLWGNIPQLDLIAEGGFVSVRGSKRRSDTVATVDTATRKSKKKKKKGKKPKSSATLASSRPSKSWTCVVGEEAAAGLRDMLGRAAKIVKMYCDRTNGAVMTKTPSMVSFDYYHSDPEYGNMQANSLKAHLAAAFKDEPMKVVVQDLCLTVTHSAVSYLNALREMYGELTSANPPPPASALQSRRTTALLSQSGQQFCLAVGTKRLNPVFKALYDRSAHHVQSRTHTGLGPHGKIPGAPRVAKVFTVTTVNSSTTEARFFVDDAEDARAIFAILANLSSKMSRSVSTAAVDSLHSSDATGSLMQKSGAGALGGFTTKESLVDLRSQLYHGTGTNGALGLKTSKGSWGSFSSLAAKNGGGIPVGPPTAAIKHGLGSQAGNLSNLGTADSSADALTPTSGRVASPQRKARKRRGRIMALLHYIYTLLLRIWQSALLKYVRQLIGLGRQSPKPN